MRYLYTQPSWRKFKALQSYVTKNESNMLDRTLWRIKKKTASLTNNSIIWYELPINEYLYNFTFYKHSWNNREKQVTYLFISQYLHYKQKKKKN